MKLLLHASTWELLKQHIAPLEKDQNILDHRWNLMKSDLPAINRIFIWGRDVLFNNNIRWFFLLPKPWLWSNKPFQQENLFVLLQRASLRSWGLRHPEWQNQSRPETWSHRALVLAKRCVLHFMRLRLTSRLINWKRWTPHVHRTHMPAAFSGTKF